MSAADMTSSTDAPASTSPRKRPLSVTLLALFVLTIACVNLVRWIQALKQWSFLASLPGVSPFYIFITGLVWALAGLSIFTGLWLGLRWAPAGTRIVILLYSLYI